MQYFKVDSDIYIEYDGKRAVVLSTKSLEAQKADLEARLEELPTDLSDKDLLAWAKENYPPAEHLDEVNSLEASIVEINSRLENMNG